MSLRGNLIRVACFVMVITLLVSLQSRPPNPPVPTPVQKVPKLPFRGDVVAEHPQTISSLTDEDAHRLAAQRKVVEQYLADDESRQKYRRAAGKLGTLRGLVNAKVFKPEQTYELQSMGIVLGDAFVQDIGFHWVMVEDEYGRDPAIRYRETSVILFPLTMISKRIERGEAVDVFGLYNGIAADAQQLICHSAAYLPYLFDLLGTADPRRECR